MINWRDQIVVSILFFNSTIKKMEINLNNFHYYAVSENGTRLPVNVFGRAYIYFLQNLEAHDLQFKIHALLQLRYVDPRLVFKQVSPKRTEPIMGENSLKESLWVPHIFLANERSSSILGTSEKDVLTSVSPDGTVIISYRIQATLYCWMNLQKFPFDEQHCSTILESCMYFMIFLMYEFYKHSFRFLVQGCTTLQNWFFIGNKDHLLLLPQNFI